jgi:gliding motility-associated-like protein
LWSGVQSGLSGASAAGGAATGMSIATKAIIGVLIASVAIVSSIVIFSKNETNKNNQAQVENSEPTKEIKKNTSEDLAIKESNENLNTPQIENERETKNETKETVNIEVKNNENQIIEVPSIETDGPVINKQEETEPQNPLNTPKQIEENTEESKEQNKESEITKPLIADVSIEKQDNQYVKFKVKGENIARIEWYFGDGKTSSDISPEHFYEEAGNFEVVVAIYGEEDKVIEKKININVEVKGKFTKLPNIISPNNDGSNDELLVGHEGIEEFKLTIYNQQQELIYKTENIDFRWRGTDLKGNLVPKGKYVYVIMARDKAGNVINKYESLDVER